MSATFLPQIKKIVFLMLENRSLDNVLGWLYSSNPPHVYPQGSPAQYNGLRRDTFFNPAYTWTGAVKRYPVVPCPPNLGDDQDRVPAYDPYEEFKVHDSWNGVMNQLFGNQDLIGGLPQGGTTPGMLGFLQDYYAWYMVTWEGLDILWTYTPEQLPIINGLARKYGVSDAWFCSVPTQTNPNRAYSLCGTSLGRENNLTITAVEQFDVPTVINSLATKVNWGLYFTDVWKNNLSYTEYTFPWISRAPNGERGNIDLFLSRARDGSLPAFSYLEPKWGYGKGSIFVQGTDYHPPSHVRPGETFLDQVYTALRNGPNWNETLLVVTFDEHGGTYDHVAPRWGAINPDGRNGANGFKFDLLGVRVPTLLISPYIQSGTVFRAPTGGSPFDHTSFIKTFLLWAGIDPNSVNLGKRMPAASTFEGVFSSKIVNNEILEAPQLSCALESPDASEGPAGAGKPVNELFEGIPFASVRAILNASTTLSDVQGALAKYKEDPASLGE